MIGCVQPGTRRGTFLQMIGSREDHAAEDVADRAVGRAPHLLEAELLDALLVGRDRGALDADAVLLDGVRRVDRHLVVGGVAVLDAEVVVLEVDVEIGVDQLLLDERPDDPGHLVAVELHHRVVDLDLRHRATSRKCVRGRSAPLPGARLSGFRAPGEVRLSPGRGGIRSGPVRLLRAPDLAGLSLRVHCGGSPPGTPNPRREIERSCFSAPCARGGRAERWCRRSRSRACRRL